jgi:hypothetical protein
MIKLHDLHRGDYVMVNFEGKIWEGEVTDVDKAEHKACVLTDVQEFWYDAEDIHPIVLDENQLFRLGFERQNNDDGSVKYMKGPFRLLIQKEGNFTELDIWYREDRRHIKTPLYVHELQNHYRSMTKIELHHN